MFFQCYVCHRERPVDICVSHHKIPRAAGGSDGPPNEVPICHDCHGNIHVISSMLLNKKRAGRVGDTIKAMYPRPDSQQNIAELASLVSKYITMKKDGHLPDQGEIDEQIVISLPRKYKRAIQILANERTHPGSKRRVGIIPFVRAILIDYVHKNFSSEL